MIDWLSLDAIAAGRLGLPDTASTRAAHTLCRDASEPFLANHQLRSYLWSSVLGHGRGIAVDHEALFIAAALHDLGLTDQFGGDGCFEVIGADAARQFLIGLGWSEERAEVVRLAIVLHVEPSVPIEAGPVAHVLDLGITLDVSGGRLDEIDPATKIEVLEALPRLDFKRRMTDLLRGDAHKRPECATALWFDEIDLAGRIASAGFDD